MRIDPAPRHHRLKYVAQAWLLPKRLFKTAIGPLGNSPAAGGATPLPMKDMNVLALRFAAPVDGLIV